MQKTSGVNRKIAFILAALIVPGGFIALLGAFLFKAVGRTERGKKVMQFARNRVPAFATQFRAGLLPAKQAA